MKKSEQIVPMEHSRRSLLRTLFHGMVFVTALGVSAVRNVALAAKNSKEAVKYQDKPNGDQRCDNCKLFEPPNKCKSVEGDISPDGWCKIWIKKA